MNHKVRRILGTLLLAGAAAAAQAQHGSATVGSSDASSGQAPVAPVHGADPTHNSPTGYPITAREYAAMQMQRTMTHTVEPSTQANVGMIAGSCECTWDNGGFDGWNGQGSAQGAAFTGRCADDFFLPECGIYRLDQVAAVMLLDTPGDPTAFLEIYEDCNGKPSGEPIGVYQQATAVFLGNFIGGLEAWEFTFDTSHCNLRGGNVYWVSPVGQGDGSFEDVYYFATTTAPFGGVQLNQGQFTNPFAFNPVVDWSPVELTNVKKRDFAFAVCATKCDILWDNGQADLARELNKNVSANLPNFRAADNFALAPCADWYIDMIEVCVLTSCECAQVNLEVYATDPITMLPIGSPLFTATDPKVFDLNYSQPDNTGVVVRAKRLQFAPELDLGEVLEGGKTYWVSIVEGGTLSASDRLYFCYAFKCEKPADCQVQITEAAFFKPVLGAWGPYSQFVSNGDDPNELAFLVCGRRAEIDAGDADGAGHGVPIYLGASPMHPLGDADRQQQHVRE